MNRRAELLDINDQAEEMNRAERAEARYAGQFDWPPSIEELMRPTRAEAEADERYMRGDR